MARHQNLLFYSKFYTCVWLSAVVWISILYSQCSWNRGCNRDAHILAQNARAILKWGWHFDVLLFCRHVGRRTRICDLWMAFVCVCGWWTICRQPVRFVYRFVGFLTWSTTLSFIVAAQSDRTSLTDTNVQASCKVLSPTEKKWFLGWRVWLILFISKFLFQFGLFHFLALKATVENETFVFETGNS